MKTKLVELPRANADTYFTFPVLRLADIKGYRYAIHFNGAILDLPFKPKGNYVEISGRDLFKSFRR